jgi:hypothetical protein
MCYLLNNVDFYAWKESIKIFSGKILVNFLNMYNLQLPSLTTEAMNGDTTQWVDLLIYCDNRFFHLSKFCHFDE